MSNVSHWTELTYYVFCYRCRVTVGDITLTPDRGLLIRLPPALDLDHHVHFLGQIRDQIHFMIMKDHTRSVGEILMRVLISNLHTGKSNLIYILLHVLTSVDHHFVLNYVWHIKVFLILIINIAGDNQPDQIHINN